MIQIKGLRHWHDKRKPPVLNNIDLKITSGITGLLGKNGAGKSTLLKILATAVSIEEGEYYYNSVNIKRNSTPVRRVLGYLPQNFTFYQNFTIDQILNYIGLLKGGKRSGVRSRIDFLLEFFRG